MVLEYSAHSHAESVFLAVRLSLVATASYQESTGGSDSDTRRSIAIVIVLCVKIGFSVYS